jgi:chemotaxis protein histidine kinase CheA|nr:MAG TPA: L SHAPED TAIL FIBER PROTEIN [Caudoviricetes sp.]
MTITLNADYDVTLSTALLGYVGETNARHVSVEGMEIDGADRYVLTIDYGDGTVYEVDITGGQWTPTADILRSAQTVSCQIAAKKLSGDEYVLVKKSRIFRLRIGAAIGDTAIPSPSVAADALDRIDAIGRQTHADMQTAVTAAETATTAAENAEKSATTAGVSADTATQAASRAETAQASAETSATQAETAMQGAETARQQAVTQANAAKISAAQASASAQQTEADKTITAGYAKTAKTCADSTAADRQAVTDMATQVTADKATVAENAAKVAEDRTATETAAQKAQSVADSLPEDYTTAVGKIAENTAEIANVKLTDKELQRRVDALYFIGQGITHQFETDSETAYQKTVPTGAKLMSVKSIGGHSEVIDGEIVSAGVTEVVEQGRNLFDVEKCAALGLYYGFEIDTNKTLQIALKDGKTCPTNVSFGIVYVHGNTMANWLITSNGVRETITNSRDMTDSTQIMVACYPGNKETMQSIADAFDIMLVDGIYKPDTMPAYAPFHRNEYPIPEAIRALPGYGWSAGTARNYVDYENKRYVQCVNSVDLGTLEWLYRPEQQRFYAIADSITGKFSESFGIVPNIVVAKYDIVCFNDITTKTDNMKASAVKTANDYITIRNTAYTDATAFKQAMQGVILYYELATPIVTDISSLIPDDFLRNIEVEAKGSVTFKNSNGDDYRIPVPSEEEYIVKLSEVGGTT